MNDKHQCQQRRQLQIVRVLDKCISFSKAALNAEPNTHKESVLIILSLNASAEFEQMPTGAIFV